MSVVLPQPSTRVSIALAVLVVVGGLVLAVAMVRGLLAAAGMPSLIRDCADAASRPVPAPPTPK